MICVVCGCDDPDGRKRIVFFKLPVNPITREKWLKILKLTCMPEGGAVCSNHFKPSEFRRINGKLELEAYAVPETLKTKKLSRPVYKTMENSPETIVDTPLEEYVESSVVKLKVEPLKTPKKLDKSKYIKNNFFHLMPAQKLPEQAISRSPSLDPNAASQPACKTIPTPVLSRVSPSHITQYKSTEASGKLHDFAPLPPAPNHQTCKPNLILSPVAPPISKQQSIETTSTWIPPFPPTTNRQSTAKHGHIAGLVLGSPPQTAPKLPNGCLTPRDTMVLHPPPIKLKSIGTQTIPLKTNDGKQPPKRRFFVSPRYISPSPISHVQAVKIGEKGVTAMPFTSTICRSSQTSVYDLNLPVPDRLVNSTPRNTDISRFDPLTLMVRKDENITLKLELAKANRKIEKLKGMIEKKNKQIRSTAQILHRKLKRIECLEEMILDLKTPLNKPMPKVLDVPPELEEDFNENVRFITSLKVAEYDEMSPDNSILPMGSVVDGHNPSEEHDVVPIFSINGAEIIEKDMFEMVTSIDSSKLNSENMQKFEIVQEPPAIIYSTYMPSENVR